MSVAGIVSLADLPLFAQPGGALLEGKAAFGDWRADKPGTRLLIKPRDLPAAAELPSAHNFVRVTHRGDQKPVVPPGFEVNLFASGLAGPRTLRTAPNGDIFVAESGAGRIRVLRPKGGEAAKPSVFASGVNYPFGIAFYPPGPDPQWVYIGDTDAVLRFPYRNGDLTARGAAETIVAHLPVGGHSTRNVAFSPDGATMYVSVGSSSNDAEGMASSRSRNCASGPPIIRSAPPGETKPAAPTSWRSTRKATTKEFSRPASAIAPVSPSCPRTAPCAERDGLGDDVPTDYITRVRDGAFYGWPWYCIGVNADPRHPNERPDLKDRITVPDVLVQPHSASLGLTFYDGAQFPASYRGNIFAAEQGSWNRAKRTGYKIIRVVVDNAVPTGEYDDFVTGFVINDSEVWGGRSA